MVYKLIQYILRLYLPVFFKRLEFRGLDNIPKDKPVIFAVNHQNAFLDGILVALKQRRPIFFFLSARTLQPEVQEARSAESESIHTLSFISSFNPCQFLNRQRKLVCRLRIGAWS